MCGVSLENIIVTHLVKMFPIVYWTQKFITVSTRPHNWPIPWAGKQSLQTTLLFLQDILILSSHLYLCLPSGLFPSGFPTKTLYIFLFYSMCATCSTHFIFLDITILIYYIWNTVCKLTITANDANFWSTVKPSYNIYGKENNTLGLFTEKRSENIL